MRTSAQKEHMEMMKSMLIASLISADNDKYPEKIKQEIIDRYNKYKNDDCWGYILNPLSEAGITQEQIDRYVEILRS